MLILIELHGLVIVLALIYFNLLDRKNDFSAPWHGYDRLERKMAALVESITLHAAQSADRYQHGSGRVAALPKSISDRWVDHS